MIDVHQNAALSESFEGDRSRVIGNRCKLQAVRITVVSDVRISFRLKKYLRCKKRRLKLGQLSVILLSQQSGREILNGVSRGITSTGRAPASHAGGTGIDTQILHTASFYFSQHQFTVQNFSFFPSFSHLIP